MLAVFVSSQSAACVVSGIISAYRVLAEELQSHSPWGRRGDVLKFPRSFTAITLTRARVKKKGRPADLTGSPSGFMVVACGTILQNERKLLKIRPGRY